MSDRQKELRSIPSVNSILMMPEMKSLQGVPEPTLVHAVREVLAEVRRRIEAGETADMSHEHIASLCAGAATGLLAATPLRVVNATGIVIHTNLGRAPLPARTRSAMALASGYCDLEFDLDSGERGSRHTHIEGLLAKTTSAEAAMAVNNNAAAVLLVLSALAAGREVIVSRGELVEIGGSFRVPEIMQQSGARLVEVGTTNRTRLDDYRKAVTGETALILKVHTSNYRIIGFTESVEAKALAALAHEVGLPLFFDAGSGLMVDLSQWGLDGEPVIPGLIADGCDIVTFSGDKLLGGPQAGIIAGKARCLSIMKQHPLARAVRLDKATLAGLSATLRIYAYGDPLREVPVLKMLTLGQRELESRARSLGERLKEAAPSFQISTAEDESYPGGGSFPAKPVKSVVVRAVVPGMGPGAVAELLRRNDPPVIARVHESAVLMDPRTFDEEDESAIIQFFERLYRRQAATP